jgi:NAD(P)-dependent dehydrogenase (short-subunit alcohol dehydrogenase family)
MNAVVTGASRGIGAAVAERLAAEGANVAITARTVDRHDHLAGSLNQTLERCKRYGTAIEVVAADLADADERDRIVPTAEAALGGPIGILVNNAAAGIHQLSAEIPLRRRRVMFEVNLQAPIDLAQGVIPGMRDRGRGWIVNLSSGGARLVDGPPFPGTVLGTTNGTYAATKAALNRYTNVLAVELYGTGIRVNTIEPADPVATEGAIAHLGDGIDADRYEPVEVMVEGVIALCECPPERTGGVYVDQPLLRDLDAEVWTLDGRTPVPGWPRPSPLASPPPTPR